MSHPDQTLVGNAVKPWPSAVLACATERLAQEAAARLVFETAARDPDPEGCIVLPTGRTAASLFSGLLRTAGDYAEDPFDGHPVVLDTETFGVPYQHMACRAWAAYRALFEPLRRQGKHVARNESQLLGSPLRDKTASDRLQVLLRLHRPVIHALAISPAGEVLGYEADVYADLEPLVSDLLPLLTVSLSAKNYIDKEQPFPIIRSLGMSVPLSAKMLLLLVFDVSKAGAVRQLMASDEDPKFPASLLKRNPNGVLLATREVLDTAGIPPTFDITRPADVLPVLEWLAG
ncbi:hypothetical protein [Thiomonas sp.]